MINIYVVLDSQNNIVIANMGSDDLEAISNFKSYIDEIKKDDKDNIPENFDEYVNTLKIIKVCSLDIPSQMVKGDFSLLAFLGGEKEEKKDGEVNA